MSEVESESIWVCEQVSLEVCFTVGVGTYLDRSGDVLEVRGGHDGLDGSEHLQEAVHRDVHRRKLVEELERSTKQVYLELLRLHVTERLGRGQRQLGGRQIGAGAQAERLDVSLAKVGRRERAGEHRRRNGGWHEDEEGVEEEVDRLGHESL